MEEIWKDVVGYEGSYQVSSWGRVKSLKAGKEKILSEIISTRGYCQLLLYKRGEKRVNAKVHRLVATAFLPNPYDLPEVNHINGFRHDNNISNLEWCTREENHKHARSNLMPRKKYQFERHNRQATKPL